MIDYWVFVVLVSVLTFTEARNHSSNPGAYEVLSDSYGDGEICNEPQLQGVEWILSQQEPNYGWSKSNHRAIITIFMDIFVNRTQKNDVERELMAHQLELKLAKIILGNGTDHLISESELALYINALLAIGRNPRDFGSIDLVEILKNMVGSLRMPHPFAVLGLCNARAITNFHLRLIEPYLKVSVTTNYDIETQAIALKAFACAAADGLTSNYEELMLNSAKALARLQRSDFSFGNVFRTAIVVQALKAVNLDNLWDKEGAKEFLSAKKAEFADITSIYYIEMALRSEVNFIREMSPVSSLPSEYQTLEQLKKQKPKKHIQYTIKVGRTPEIFHMISIKVPSNSSFFDVMRLAAADDPTFRFLYSSDQNNEMYVYSISGVPNNAEDGHYWKLYENTKDEEEKIIEITKSVLSLKPAGNSHHIFWFLDIFSELPVVELL